MIILFLAFIVTWLLKRMLNDKSATIKELREENKNYRDTFRGILEENFRNKSNSITTNEESPNQP